MNLTVILPLTRTSEVTRTENTQASTGLHGNTGVDQGQRGRINRNRCGTYIFQVTASCVCMCVCVCESVCVYVGIQHQYEFEQPHLGESKSKSQTSSP